MSSFFTEGESQKTFIKCSYCRGEHFSSECTKVMSSKAGKSILQKEGHCFVCLRTGNLSRSCQNKRNCRNCSGRHHQLICSNLDIQEKEAEQFKENGATIVSQANSPVVRQQGESQPENQVVTAAARSNTSNRGVVLQTAKTYAFGPDPNSKQLVRVLFDLCSQRTYISEELKQKLNLKSLKTETLNLNTFRTDKFRKQKCDLIEINLEGRDGSVIRLKPLVFPIICSPLSSSININEFPHLQGLEFADDFDGSQDCIDLLVGADQYFQIVSGDTIRGESENGPVAMSSKLGWLLVGPVINSESDVSDCISNLVIEGNSSYDARKNEDQELVQTLKRFWEIEQCGVEDNLDKRTNEFCDSLTGVEKQRQGNENNVSFSGQEKQVCSNHFDAQFKGKHYEVGLPWQDDLVCDPISSDYRLCQDRLKSLYVKLKGKPELMAEYDAIFREELLAGIIEQVPVSRENEVGVHFMPHHGVVRKDHETSKLRIVFDGSAKQNADEFSLNEHLGEGPNYIPSLFDVLVKFEM